MRTRAQEEEASDAAYLATFLDVASSDLDTLLTTPTPELVGSLVRAISHKAGEFEDLKTEKLKVNVEFNDAVRSAEKKAAIQKNTITKQAKEIEDLRKSLASATASGEQLASQLGASKGAASDSNGEVELLRARVESLESSKRDTLALLDAKTAEKDRVHDELNEQHGKLVALRREYNELEQRNQSLENLTSTQKFKESSLRQELDLLRKNNEWQDAELKTTSQEHSKFRKDRNLTINKLQHELEEATAAADALKVSETTLRQRLSDLESKLEEAYEKQAETQESHTRAEQSLREQIESSKRLAELQGQNANMHKAQVQSLQAQLDDLRDQAAQEIGKLHDDVDTERAEKESVERRLAELEIQLERAEQQPRPSAPSTPILNGSPRIDSVKASKALTQTQLYGQYVEVKESFAREERRCAKLQAALDELILDMESKAPELVEMRQEQERLEAEVLSFSRMLDEANALRDNALRDATRSQNDASAAAQECELLRQQLRDVSAQVKILLVETQSREQGLGEMTVQERLELERAARGESGQLAIENGSSTQSLISERLVIFRSVAELQQQNEHLLRITRELGEQMEGQEAQEKARQSAAQVTEAEELRAQIERYKDELQATATQIDSYMKERDMFRRMLQHRGTLGPNADVQAMFGSSIAPATPQRNGEPSTPRAKELDELNKLLKDQQLFFDQFRQESASDRTLLKNQIDGLTRERSSLQADVGRSESQLALAAQRYELLQSNFSSLRSENTALQQRLQGLVESAAKQDLRAQQLVDDLLEARSNVDTLRNETATTKAEKELWKRIEDRLTEDNKNLLDDRSRLNKLVVDMQTMANERELSESEARRRLSARTEQLETELAETKRKLELSTEETKKASMRKDFEESQNKTRIDDLVKSLSTAREDLAGARSARDQLQARVDEMRIDLRAAQDKLATLQPARPTMDVNGNANGDSDANNESGLTVEQRLNLQITDIRQELDRANNDLISAREQIERYKSIAQSTEEELHSFNQTSEQYREETDRLAAEKEAEVQALQQRVEDLSTELSTTNAELSDLRTRHDEASKNVDTERLALESELARLRDDEHRHAQEKTMYQEDIKAQAEIAQQAQQSYENELLKHADAARQLQIARQERDTLREDVIAARKEAQSASIKLQSGEESWAEQKDRFEAEAAEVRRRKADGDGQIKVLHQQLETFSNELQALRQGRVSMPEGEIITGDSGSRLQEVIAFLRREKEIIEVQHELSTNENKRLQQQLTHTQGRLDEIELKLAEERKANNERSASEASTTRLAAAIDELNLFRESAVTLRNEAKQAKEKLAARNREIEQLQAEIEPLRAKLGELEADVESKDQEIQLITKDRDHWRDRTQSIISKYDRVDPAELEELRNRISELDAQREQAVTELETLRSTNETLSAQSAQYDQLTLECRSLQEAKDTLENQLVAQAAEAKTASDERAAKLIERSKEQDRKQRTRIADGLAAIEAAQAEVLRLQEELAAVKQASETNSAEPSDSTEGEQLQKAKAEIAEHVATNSALQTRIVELELQLVNLSTEVEELKAAAASVTPHEPGEISDAPDQAAQLALVQQQLTVAQGEIEQLRARAAAQPAAAPSADENGLPELTDDQVTQLIRTNARIKTIVGNSVKKNVGKETERLSKALSDKDEEIAKLKEAAATQATTQTASTTDTASDPDKQKEELQAQLATAQQEKEAALKAMDLSEKKIKLQLSQKDIAQARVAAVQKAAVETPQKPVVEVWEVAKNAKPAPKAAAPANKVDTSNASGTGNKVSTPTDSAKPASGIPQPAGKNIEGVTRGPGGINIRGRGGGAAGGVKRAHDGAANNSNNKRPRG